MYLCVCVVSSPVQSSPFIILTCDFSKEQYVLPEDDMRYAIEICRSILSVLV